MRLINSPYIKSTRRSLSHQSFSVSLRARLKCPPFRRKQGKQARISGEKQDEKPHASLPQGPSRTHTPRGSSFFLDMICPFKAISISLSKGLVATHWAAEGDGAQESPR